MQSVFFGFDFDIFVISICIELGGVECMIIVFHQSPQLKTQFYIQKLNEQNNAISFNLSLKH